jgi:hypothetical protein
MILRASILAVFLSTSAFAEGNVTPVRNGTQIAQASPACGQIRQAYNQCKQSWQNIGGGSTGQAGSFKECMDAYYKAGIAAGCWQ